MYNIKRRGGGPGGGPKIVNKDGPHKAEQIC